MARITTCELPDNALSRKYLDQGAHTDCYYIDIPEKITLTQYIQAFYSTPVFSIEKALLAIFAKKYIKNQDINALANGSCNSFSIWTVEQRTDNQILLCEFTKKTRSWLMLDYIGNQEQAVTRPYFGSVVIPKPIKNSSTDTTNSSFGLLFHLLSGFHKLYSRALLKSAFNKLSRI